MLGNHGIRQGAAAQRHPEALLQARQGQGLTVLGVLQKGEHQLKGGHPHCDVQRLGQGPQAQSASLRKQPGCRIMVTAGKQVLPEVPPALVGKEVALVAAMEQRPGLGAQAIDQVLQIDAPGPRAMAAAAIDPGQLAAQSLPR